MAVNASYKVTLSLADQSGERTSMRANEPEYLAVGAGVPTAVQNFVTALQTAVDPNGTPTPLVSWGIADALGVSSSGNRKVASGVNFAGNREDKLLFLFEDNTTLAPYSATVPGRIGSLATVPGSDKLPTETVTAMKASAEALFFSPDGNAGTLRDILLIGRNT